MSPSPVTPVGREAIDFTDKLRAITSLAMMLAEIPEFDKLWRQERRSLDGIMPAVAEKMSIHLKGMSPSGRGALFAFEDPVFDLYDDAPREEARGFVVLMTIINRVVDDILKEQGAPPDYRKQLEQLVEPLGVPEIVDTLVVLDGLRWGLGESLANAGKIDGPFMDLLSGPMLRHLTDLEVVELATETPGRIRKRMRQKTAPLGRHFNRYGLSGRIELWVENVVLGVTLEQIATRLQKDEQRVATGDSSYDWIRKQVRDASRLLGYKRAGRPRKGGVLRQWKLMAE